MIGKYTFFGFLTVFTIIGITFAATRITALNQTAVAGDTITAEWVNAVNAAIQNQVASAGGCQGFNTSQDLINLVEAKKKMPVSIRLQCVPGSCNAVWYLTPSS